MVQKKFKIRKTIHIILLILCILFAASATLAELRLESVYPTLGVTGQDMKVTMTGSGFDKDISVSIYPDISNRRKIIGSVETPDEGRDIALVGDTAYVADRSAGLLVIDVSNPESPEIVGTADTSGNAVAVTVVGKNAYVADGNGGVHVIDVSNAKFPAIIRTMNTPGFAEALVVSGDTLYVAWGERSSNSGGIQVIDLGKAEPHALIGAVETSGYVSDIAISREIAYIVSDSNANLQLIDLSVAENPKIIASLNTKSMPQCVTVSGETAYVGVGSAELQIIDVGNPESPMLIGSVSMPALVLDLAVKGELVYAACYNGGLQMIDVSSFENPQVVGTVRTSGYATALALVGETAYVADSHGFHLINVRIAAGSMEIVRRVSTPTHTSEFTVVGENAYVTWGNYENQTRNGGLQVISVGDPENFQVIGSLDMPGHASDIVIVGKNAYVASGDLQIIDVADPESPAIIGSMKMPDTITQVASICDTPYLMIGMASNFLHVLDVSNHDNPTVVGTVETQGTATEIRIIEDTAYVAERETGLQTVDVSRPEAPQIIGTVDTPGRALGVAVTGDTAYVADGFSGLQIVDISKPENPRIIGTVNTSGTALGVVVTGDTAYVADGFSGLQVIDVSTPQHPNIVGSINNDGYLTDHVAVIGETAYVTDVRSLAVTSPVPLVRKLPPESLTLEKESRMSVTLPAPETPGHYTLRVCSQYESHELRGAVSFVTPEKSYLLDTKAIIAAGGSTGSDNKIWEEIEMAADHAYNALLYQGYTAESIYYLSSDGDSEKADARASLANLSYAVNEWTREYPPASELLLFFADHGDKEEFVISPEERLSAGDLDRWLDALQKPLDDSQKPIPVTFVYDACRSGTFLPRLIPSPGAERILVSSASDQPAWYLGEGTLSFSYQFWDAIYKGQKVGGAFSHGSEQMKTWQIALLDADGNGIGNEPEDEARAADMSIRRGYRPETDVPYIYDVSDPQIVYEGRSAEFWAAVSYAEDASEIRRIWAVITPPDFYPGSPDIPVSDLPETELTDMDGDGTYTGAYKELRDKGEYVVKICAVSKKGVYALFRDTIVIKSAQYVRSVSDRQVLYGENTASLQAVVSRGDASTAIARVWAEITPPISGPAVVAEFHDPDSDGVYEASCENLTAEGTYIVAVYSKDSEGFVCPPVTTSVRRAPAEPEADKHEPDDIFAQASTADIGGDIRHHTFHDAGDTDWTAFFGITGMAYRIRAERPGEDCDPVIEIWKPGDSESLLLADISGPGEEELAEWTCPRTDIYYVSLRNADPEIFGKDVGYDFSIHSPTASETGTVRGTVTDIYGNPLSGAGIMTESGASDLSRYDGSYSVRASVGTRSLMACAEGYEQTEISVTVNADEAVTQNIIMMPVEDKGETALRNALFILRLLTGDGEYPQIPVQIGVNGDGRLGLEDVICLLQNAAEFRTLKKDR